MESENMPYLEAALRTQYIMSISGKGCAIIGKSCQKLKLMKMFLSSSKWSK